VRLVAPAASGLTRRHDGYVRGGLSLAVAMVFSWLTRKMMVVGGILLVLMMVLTCIDIVGRMLGYPVFGAFELISFMAALVVALSLPDTHARKRHIGVEILTSRLPRPLRLRLALATDLLALLLFSVVGWRMFVYALRLRQSGEVSMNLGMPEYGITFAVALGFSLFAVAIVKTCLETLKELKQ
jgi:TRAP-type C4-dicarboxylate transport system permease small subunit